MREIEYKENETLRNESMRETNIFVAFNRDLSVIKGIILKHGNRLSAIGLQN